MQSLRGKRAAIAGASSGIGAAIAEHFAEEGASLVLGARRQDRLAEVARAIRERVREASVETFPLDVTDERSADGFARAAHAKGPVDILVNNAGLVRGLEPLDAGSEGEQREVVETNVLGVLRLARLFLPRMKERGEGHVITIGSVAGLDPYAGGAVYCATKAAVQVASQALRHELHGTGLRVTVVDPGLVDGTEFSLVRFRGDDERAKKPYQGVKPLSPRDVAECVVFAASRPPHVNVDEILVLATAQVGATKIARK